MNFFNLTHNWLLMLLMISLSLLAACDPSVRRDPGGITNNSTPYTPELSLTNYSGVPIILEILIQPNLRIFRMKSKSKPQNPFLLIWFSFWKFFHSANFDSDILTRD